MCLRLKFGFDRTTHGGDRDTPKNTTSSLFSIRSSPTDQTRSPIVTRDISADELLPKKCPLIGIKSVALHLHPRLLVKPQISYSRNVKSL